MATSAEPPSVARTPGVMLTLHEYVPALAVPPIEPEMYALAVVFAARLIVMSPQ